MIRATDGGWSPTYSYITWSVINHAPTLAGYDYYVEADVPLEGINFLDHADDEDGDDLTFTPGTGPWQGQLSYSNNVWTYTPATSWTGTVSDGYYSGSFMRTFTLSVPRRTFRVISSPTR